MDIAQVYETHKNFIYRLALSYTCSPADAEDVCQEAFLKFMDSAKKIRPGKERAWLATVAANLCKNRLRAARRDAGGIPADRRTEIPEKGALFYEVMALPEHERVVIYLHYFEGYDTREIAGILRISQTAVTSRMARARKRLRERLEAEEDV